MGETVDGDILRGEVEIGNDGRKLKKVFYDEEPHIDKEVINSILAADLIIFSIGSLFTSIIPNLLSKKIIKAIDKTNAKILYTCNAVTQVNETDNYTVSNHVEKINSYLGSRKIDAVIVPKGDLPENILNKYKFTENKTLVKLDRDNLDLAGCEVILDNMLIVSNDYIRHDPIKLAISIFNYLMR